MLVNGKTNFGVDANCVLLFVVGVSIDGLATGLAVEAECSA